MSVIQIGLTAPTNDGYDFNHVIFAGTNELLKVQISIKYHNLQHILVIIH